MPRDNAKAQSLPHLVALRTLAGDPSMKESLTIKADELLIEHYEKQVKEMDDDQMNSTLIYHTAIKLYEETLFRVCGYESLMKLATEADKRIEKEFGKKRFGFAEGVHENFQHRASK
jgi:hypothetical protein